MSKKSEPIVVPQLGESVVEATVAQWLKSEGDQVSQDETLVELETEKVTLEVNAPRDGVLTSITAKAGDTVNVGDTLGTITEGKAKPAAASTDTKQKPVAAEKKEELSPAVRKMVEEKQLHPSDIEATGKGGRVTKEDVVNFLEKPPKIMVPSKAAQVEAVPKEKRVRMTRLRQTIASRLKEAQNTAAMLTTFNEVDMTHVMQMRGELKNKFEKKHGVKLGFMSFFVKASVLALQEIPAVNAEIAGDEIVYKNHYDIGVAVGTPNGLVVPVLRDANYKSFADVEQGINALAVKARDGKIAVGDLTGGTFTISNGGVYGSLLSTPILNPPQSGILGMHKIQQRPVAVDDKIEVRPMMYLALTYDHRIIDGKEAVHFLVRVKECIENPERMLLDT